MSFNNLIDSQLAKAFNLLKDQAVVAVFTSIDTGEFNFGTGQLAETAAAPKTIKVVAIEDNRPSKDKKTIKKTILARKRDIDVLNITDKVTLGGFDWKIGDIKRESGRIWLFEIIREA